MNVLIVEDEAPAARRLARITSELLGEEAGSLAIKASVEEAEQHLASCGVDVVLLDLNLNGSSGFDLLSRMTAGSFHTIVVSASLDKALAAFEYGVLDFVPKPVERERLARAFSRLRAQTPEKAPGIKILSVKSFGAVRLVPIETVRFFKAADDYVELHLKDGRMELYGKSLDSLARLLPPQYCRIHRSYIVNMLDAREIRVFGGGRYELHTRDGAMLPVSRSRYNEIRTRMESGMIQTEQLDENPVS